jgi:hypothetical protein
MSEGPGAESAPAGGAPEGGTPAPGDERTPQEMLGEVLGTSAESESAEGGEGDQDKDWKAEAEKWKGLSRKNEQRARENSDAAKRLKDIEQSQMSEQQKMEARAVEAETRAARAEQQHWRTLAVASNELPVEAIELLGGTTEDEINANAAAFAGIVAAKVQEALSNRGNGGLGPQHGFPRPGRPVESLRPGGAPAGSGVPQTSEDMFRSMIGKTRQ